MRPTQLSLPPPMRDFFANQKSSGSPRKMAPSALSPKDRADQVAERIWSSVHRTTPTPPPQKPKASEVTDRFAEARLGKTTVAKPATTVRPTTGRMPSTPATPAATVSASSARSPSHTPADNSGTGTGLEQRVSKLEEKQRVLRQENRALRERVEQLEALLLNEQAAQDTRAASRLSAPAAAARVQAVARGRHDRRVLEEQAAAAADIVAVALLAQEVMGTADAEHAMLEAARENPKVAGALGLVPPAVVAAFERFDTNHDQVIDYRELRAALAEYGLDASDDLAAGLLMEYDELPDGTLDIFEFSRLIKDLEAMRRQQRKHEEELQAMRVALQEQQARAASSAPPMARAPVAPPPAVPLAVPPSAQGQQAYVLVTDPTTGGQLLLPLPQTPKQ